MEKLLRIRNKSIRAYKERENWLLPLLKFLAGLLCFWRLSALSLGHGSFLLRLGIPVLAALICTVAPLGVFYGLALLAAAFFLAQISLALGLLTLLGLFLLFVFYVRLFPVESLVIPGLLLCFWLRIPLLAPLLAGLYLGLRGIIPVCAATYLWYYFRLTPELATLSSQATTTLMALPEAMIDAFVTGYQRMMDSGEWLLFALVLVIGLLVVHAFCQLWKNRARETGLAAGAVVMLVLLMALRVLGRLTVFGLPTLVLGGAAALVLALVIRAFDMVLDYQKSRTVQFSDEDFYYYVKVIPKKMPSKKM